MSRKRVTTLSLPAILGYLIFMLSGATMWLFMMYWFLEWWGLLGIIAALLLPPLATLFPFIYWWQESFPIAYLLIWLTGVLSLVFGIALSGRLLRARVRRAQKNAGKKERKNVIEGEIVSED